MRSLFALILALTPAVAHAQAVRTVPVNVVNPPAIQATEDVDNPAFQPVQFTDSRFTEISSSNTILSTGIRGDPVPAGKRLVVQHLSYSVSGSGLLGNAICSAEVLDGSTSVVSHPLPFERLVSGSSSYDRVSLPITLYAEAGEEVLVACNVRTSDDVRQRLGYTGYYVDVD